MVLLLLYSEQFGISGVFIWRFLLGGIEGSFYAFIFDLLLGNFCLCLDDLLVEIREFLFEGLEEKPVEVDGEIE